MGSDRHYPEEAPAHRVTVDGFWIDRRPSPTASSRSSSAPPAMSLRRNPARSEGLSRRAAAHALGGLARVHAAAAGRSTCATGPVVAVPRVPIGGTVRAEAQHQRARQSSGRACRIATRRPTRNGPARNCRPRPNGNSPRAADSTDAEFAWGDEFTPGGVHMANTWQGEFPHQNLTADGFERTSPVMAFPPNGYGLHDMIGNVWEWTSDWYSPKHEAAAPKACCIPENPRGGREDAATIPASRDQNSSQGAKGGSHLCAPNYCRRYRPAARHAEPVDTSTSHVGFRCVIRDSANQGRDQ